MGGLHQLRNQPIYPLTEYSCCWRYKHLCCDRKICCASRTDVISQSWVDHDGLKAMAVWQSICEAHR